MVATYNFGSVYIKEDWYIYISTRCADPESIVRGGSNFDNDFFLLMRGRRIQIPLYAGHHRPASQTPLNGVLLACR